MKHALRKYISSGGSALFMVVSTMAALMMIVTAMYFSVLSAREVKMTVYNSEQAYISSSSIADAVSAFIASNPSNSVVKQINKLKPGESVSTNGNNFAAFGGENAENDDIGAYDVTISRLENDKINGKTYYVYDLAVTVSKNGCLETTHTFMRTSAEKPQLDVPLLDRFFTATGYLPSDNWVDCINSDSTLYFNNEYTIFSQHVLTSKDTGNAFNKNVTCAGAALLDGKMNFNPDKPITFAVGNDLEISFNGGIKLAPDGSSEKGTMVVGGDLHLKQGWLSFQNCDVYVMGDVYVYAGTTIPAKLCVAGNVYFSGTQYDWGYSMPQLNVQGELHVAGQALNIDGTKNGLQNWMSDPIDNSSWPVDDQNIAIDMLNDAMPDRVYPSWPVEANFDDPIDIVFDSNPNSAKPKMMHYIDEDCKIGKVYDKYAGGGVTDNEAIIINTGDKPTDKRIIEVTANCSDGYTFRWDENASGSGGKTMSIITVGCGTLIIKVPEGVRYSSNDQEFFGHIGWYAIAGGKIERKVTNGGYEFPVASKVAEGGNSIYSIISSNNFVFDGSTECTYVKEEEDGQEYYTCTTHGGQYDEKNYQKFIDDEDSITMCTGRLSRTDILSYLRVKNAAALNTIVNYYENFSGSNFRSRTELKRDSSGNISIQEDRIFPNVNIYIVSTDREADIQYGMDVDTGGAFSDNKFFGYIYAPYMTFFVIDAAGNAKIFGGLVVSDIVISGSIKYAYIQPDQTLSVLIGDADMLLPEGNREWRRFGV